MINNLFPLLEKITGTSASPIFSYYPEDRIFQDDRGQYFQREEYCVNSTFESTDRNYITLIYTDSLTNRTLSRATCQGFLSDLTAAAGRLNSNGLQGGKDGSGLYLYIDEVAEVANDSFIQLLNKARGTGIRVTWAAQAAKNDLTVAFNGDKDKAGQVLANSQGFKIIMRTKDDESADMICDSFDDVNVKYTLPDSGVSDMHNADYRSQNRDTIQVDKVKPLSREMIKSLPNGQAFMINSGNEIYKVRIPLQSQENFDYDAEFKDINSTSDEIEKKYKTRQLIRNIMRRVNNKSITEAEALKISNKKRSHEESGLIVNDQSRKKITKWLKQLSKKVNQNGCYFNPFIDTSALFISKYTFDTFLTNQLDLDPSQHSSYTNLLIEENIISSNSFEAEVDDKNMMLYGFSYDDEITGLDECTIEIKEVAYAA